MLQRTRVAAYLCVGLTGMAAASAVKAGGFAVREQSAYGQGISFAGMAAGGSLSSMFWNPATLADVKGLEIEGVITGVIPFSEIDYSVPRLIPPTHIDEIGENKLIPSGYAAMRLNDRLVVGIGMNAPFGLATDYPSGASIRTFGVAGTAEIFSLNFNPSISYQLTDWLAVAVGAQVEYIDAEYSAIAIPGLGVTKLEGDDIAAGFTAGIRLTPFAGTEIGIGYRSFIDHELDGTLKNAATSFDATAKNFDMPDSVNIGIRQKLGERMRVMAGAEWTNWSRFDTVNVKAAGATIPLHFDYNDGWFFSGGGEYDLTRALTVRAGIGYELSPIDDSNRSFRLPDNDRLWLSAGASWAPSDRLSFDAGYSYITVADTDILSVGQGGPIGNGPFTGSADTDIHVVSLGMKLKLGGGAPH